MCGLCVEACPTRALTLTSYYDLAFTTPRRGDLDEGAAPHRRRRSSAPTRWTGRARYRCRLDLVLFWVFAPISVASAIGMLVMRNAVHAALFLIVNFFCLAIIYLLLGAPFLFAVQIIVYAGAIMVLFLFVIMLLGVDGRDDVHERRLIAPAAARDRARRWGSSLEIDFAMRAAIGFATRAPDGFDVVNEGGNAQALATVLFRNYFFPFEVTSILLIIAAIAAMVLAQRKSRAITQAEIDEHRADLDALGHTNPGAPKPGAPLEAGASMSTPIAYFLVLSSILFAIGTVGVLIRKNALIIFMSVELQLNAVNLTLVAFSPDAQQPATARSWRSSPWWWRPPRSWWASRSSCRSTGGSARSTSTTRGSAGGSARAWDSCPIPTRRCRSLAGPALPLRGRGDQPVRRQAAGQGRAGGLAVVMIGAVVRGVGRRGAGAARTRAEAAPVPQHLFEWIRVGSFSVGVDLRLDALSATMILVVTGIGTLIHVYAIGYMHGDRRFGRFFAYLNLFVFFMLMLVLGDNLLVLYLGWEGVGLCSYLLIGFWFEKTENANAAKKAFVTTRIGDTAMLVGLAADRREVRHARLRRSSSAPRARR